MHNTLSLARTLVLALGLAVSGTAHAQSVHPSIPDADLPDLMARLDQRHFDAFNQCDLATLNALYAPDVEFFHDLGGRILNHDQFIQAVRKNICAKVERRLVPGSLEAYPLAKVGVLQMGRHCFATPGQPNCIQQGRFTILWRFDGIEWHVAKVFSYDHRPMATP